MSEKNFDFKSLDLTEEERNDLVGATQEEGTKMQAKVESSEVDDYTDTEKLLENGKEKIKQIEISGLGEISYYEKKVLFPEMVIKETGGVKGYIRKIINIDNIDKTILKRIKAWEYKYKRDNNPNSLIRNDLMKEILRKLTNNDFPDKTFNHVISGDQSTSKEYLECFKEEKLIFQEILSLKLHTNSLEGAISLPHAYGVPFKLEDNKKFADREYFPEEFARIRSESKEENEPPLFYLAEEAFQVLDGDIWSLSLEGKEIIFGFGSKNKVFKEYLELCKKTIESISYDWGRFKRGELLEIYKYLLDRVNGKCDKPKPTKDDPYSFNFFSKIFRYNHPLIPLIIDHPGVLNLRWCHADYAAIPTKKGYSILEFITDKEDNNQ